MRLTIFLAYGEVVIFSPLDENHSFRNSGEIGFVFWIRFSGEIDFPSMSIDALDDLHVALAIGS